MKIRYIGPSPSVHVPALGLVAIRGEPVEADRPIAESLIEQQVWERVKPRPKKEKE